MKILKKCNFIGNFYIQFCLIISFINISNIYSADILQPIKNQEIREIGQHLDYAYHQLSQVKNELLKNNAGGDYENDPQYIEAKKKLDNLQILFELSKHNRHPVLIKYHELFKEITPLEQASSSAKPSLSVQTSSSLHTFPYNVQITSVKGHKDFPGRPKEELITDQEKLKFAAIQIYESIREAASSEYHEELEKKLGEENDKSALEKYKQTIEQARQKYVVPFGHKFYKKRIDGTKELVEKKPDLEALTALMAEINTQRQ